MKLEQIRQKRKELAASMESIAASETLTDEQALAFDAAEQEFDALGEKAARLERIESRKADLAKPEPVAAARAMRGPEAKTEFESLGEFMYAVRFNQNDQRLEYHEGLRASQSMGTGSEGGFAIPTQFASEMRSVEPSAAVVRPRATVLPAGTPPDAAISMPVLDQVDSNSLYGGVSVSWIGEGVTKPETSAALKQVTLTPHEVAGHIVVTDQLLANWQSADVVLSNLLRKAMVAAEDQAFINGNGTGKPRGFLGSGAEIEVARTTGSTVKLADLINMESALLGSANAVWLMSPAVRGVIRQLNSSTTGGSLIWGDGSIVSGAPATLLGRPVVISDRLPALGSTGDIMLADLSYYLIKDGSGPFVAASQHVHFTSNKTVIKAFLRVDGKPWLTDALILEDATEASPFVVLHS